MRGKRENPSPPASAMEALRVAAACEVSRKEGRPVRVAEFDRTGLIEGEPAGNGLWIDSWGRILTR